MKVVCETRHVRLNKGSSDGGVLCRIGPRRAPCEPLRGFGYFGCHSKPMLNCLEGAERATESKACFYVFKDDLKRCGHATRALNGYRNLPAATNDLRIIEALNVQTIERFQLANRIGKKAFYRLDVCLIQMHQIDVVIMQDQ